ncbi:MAG: histidine kinase dimerization/phospho-acceptor domain-containing protein [Verrucomicrobiales bacterium]
MAAARRRLAKDRIGQIPQLQGGDFPGAAAFSAGGDRAAWIWQQRGIGILSVSGRGLTETERFFPAGDPALFALWLAPGGDRVAAGTGDGKVHVWNLTPPGEILRALPAHAASLRPNPLPKFAAALIAGFGALAVVGSVAAWLMRRERRLLGGFLAGQRELDAHRERLRLAERMESLGRLSAGVAHDFRNILSIIRVRAGLLRRAVAGDDASAGDADAIERAVEKAEGVVRSLLHVGRPAAGNALPGSGFDAAAELADLRGLFAAKARGVEAFALDAAEGLPLAAGNPVEFHQLAAQPWLECHRCLRARRIRCASRRRRRERMASGLAATPSALWLCAEDGE